MASRVSLCITVNLPELLHSFSPDDCSWMEIENKRSFSLFVLRVDFFFLVDSIPATMMVWLLIFCKIDVNCQLQANGKQMLSRKKFQVHTECNTGLPAAVPGLPHLHGAGHPQSQGRKKRVVCYLIFYWFGNFSDQALAHLDQRRFTSCTWEHFQGRQQGHTQKHHTLAQILTLNCRSPGPSIPSINLHSWRGFSWENKRLYLH